MSLLFSGFKKKSLWLVYITYPEQLANILEEIRNKKLFQCILKESHRSTTKERIIKGYDHQVMCVIKISLTRIASASYDKTIKIWDYNSLSCKRTLDCHTGDVNCLIKLSEKLIASGSTDKTIKIWNINNGNCIKTYNPNFGPINCMVKLNNIQILCGSKKNLDVLEYDSL